MQLPQEDDKEVADLRMFLQNAPRLWSSPSDPPIRKYRLSNGEEISCIFWRSCFFITGTDIVKILMFRFHRLGRGILNPKKFEEGVFSDLRNLKPGVDAVLEEPRSEFLEFLHKNDAIRTQKKQKVFFWTNVPHEDLFREALERNLKRVSSACQWTQFMGAAAAAANANQPELYRQYMMMQAAAAYGSPMNSPISPYMMNGPYNQAYMASMMPSPFFYPQQQQQEGGFSGDNSPISEGPMRTHARRSQSMSNIEPLQNGEVFNDSYFDLPGDIGISPAMLQEPAANELFDEMLVSTATAGNSLLQPNATITSNDLQTGNNGALDDLWLGDDKAQRPLLDDLLMLPNTIEPNNMTFFDNQ